MPVFPDGVRVEPDDPRYPHGSPTGYSGGCRCPKCGRAHRHRAYALTLSHTHGVPEPRDRVPADPVRDHVKKLQDAIPGLSLKAIARAAGISERPLCDVASGWPTMWRRSSDAALAVTVEQAAKEARLVEAQPVADTIHRCAAAGWSIAWWRRRIGLHLTFIRAKSRWVTTDTAALVDRIAREIGNEFATPENSGQIGHRITSAMTYARKAGYHPPCYCDDDGRYNPRLDPEHPWSVADSRCEELLQVAAAIVRPGRDLVEESNRVLAARFGTYVEEIERVAKRLGVRGKSASRDETAVHVREVLDRVDSGDLDVVRAAVDLGLAGWKNNLSIVPRDHPAVADLLKEHEAAVEKRRREGDRARKARARGERAA